MIWSRDRAETLARSYWQWAWRELALALPPTATVMVAFLTTQFLTRHPILFASLASSSFLIYRDPQNRMNRVRVMVTAQLIGWALGMACAILFGSNYVAAGAAMTSCIILLVVLNVVHPPAISTALGFALIGPHPLTISTFLLALVMVATLAVLQRAAVWLIGRLDGPN